MMLLNLASYLILKPLRTDGQSFSVCKTIKDVATIINSGVLPDREEAERKQNIKYLKALMADARNFSEWQRFATELDKLLGNDKWAREFRDAQLEHRTQLLVEIRESGNIHKMARAVRTSLDRDIGILGDVKIYDRARVQSPNVIKQYIYSACHLVAEMANHPAITNDEELELFELFEDAIAARQNYGRTALLLSGGATFGMAHIGTIKALWEEGVLPNVIAGASAGSIICSILCTRTDAEIPELLRTFHQGDLAVFDSVTDPSTLRSRVARFWHKGTWADSCHLRRVMKGFLGDTTFLEAYHKTRRICNITISSMHRYEHQRVLNYLTAPNVTIASAVTASCSVPFFFEPAVILAKDPLTGNVAEWNMTGETYIDGSVHSDLPMEPIGEMFNVNHFVVCQVNPHVAPVLLPDNQRRPTLTSGLINAAHQEFHNQIDRILDSNILPESLNTLLNKATSITSQQYSGDVTIIPQMDLTDYANLLKNPTPEFMQMACLRGERAVWPHLPRLKDRLAVELAIDHGLERLRERMVFHPACGASRREMMQLDQVVAGSGRERRRRLSGGSVDIVLSGGHGLAPLTAIGAAPPRPSLTRASLSHHFAQLGNVRRMRPQDLPPLQHPDVFRREMLGGVDFSRPLSPCATVPSSGTSSAAPGEEENKENKDEEDEEDEGCLNNGLFMIRRPRGGWESRSSRSTPALPEDECAVESVTDEGVEGLEGQVEPTSTTAITADATATETVGTSTAYHHVDIDIDGMSDEGD